MQNKVQTLTPGSSQAEVFNVLGQLKTIEREMSDKKLLQPNQPTFGIQHKTNGSLK
jgi:hypothetical protein